ncbi:hypothetical protein E5S69_29670 [Cupriavidus necator]|uniref:hypothetical protein n=1 Tax=Cupriavidus necator TaxID=106590 RepID=UPI0014907415|nr:hypothetical protein [Cupriavidus necator]NOV27656.1 hypothetical protein [Cupriavidus necator]
MGIIESVQQYDLNIPAGGAQNIDVAGDRVQFISATDPFAQIEIRPNYAQGNISLKPGQGFRFSEQVTRWVVFNRGSVALSGYLLIGSGDFFDQRISGDVNVIDTSRSLTLTGQAQYMSKYQGPVAGQYAFVQLWNPAGSGKRLIVERVYSVNGAGSTSCNLVYESVARTLGGNLAAKLSGGAAGAGEIRAANSATPSAGQGIITLTNSFSYEPKRPLVLLPGYGITAQSSVLAGDVYMYADMVEETI